MPNCPKCNKDIAENSNFCIYCGERINADVPMPTGLNQPKFTTEGKPLANGGKKRKFKRTRRKQQYLRRKRTIKKR